MKRYFILLGLVVMLFDLANCTLLGKATALVASNSSQTEFTPYRLFPQHTKILRSACNSEDESDFEDNRLSILTLSAPSCNRTLTLPGSDGVSYLHDLIHGSHFASSGGIPL